MPTYRQLHTRIVDSFDFNNMPDDFTRIVWVLLMIVADSEGRAIDNPAWLRSKMFPMREDVQLKKISDAITWLADRNMITRYQVGGNSYFFIVTWKRYQTGTDKEGKSYLPAPEQLQTNSGVTPDQLRLNTIQYNADTNVLASEKIPEPLPLIKNQRVFDALKAHEDKRMAGEPDTSWLPEMLRPLAAAFIKATDILPTGKEHGYWIQSLTEQWEAGIKPDTLTKTVKKMRHDGLTIKNPGSCLAVARDLHGKRNSSDEVWAEVHK